MQQVRDLLYLTQAAETNAGDEAGDEGTLTARNYLPRAQFEPSGAESIPEDIMLSDPEIMHMHETGDYRDVSQRARRNSDSTAMSDRNDEHMEDSDDDEPTQVHAVDEWNAAVIGHRGSMDEVVCIILSAIGRTVAGRGEEDTRQLRWHVSELCRHHYIEHNDRLAEAMGTTIRRSQAAFHEQRRESERLQEDSDSAMNAIQKLNRRLQKVESREPELRSNFVKAIQIWRANERAGAGGFMIHMRDAMRVSQAQVRFFDILTWYPDIPHDLYDTIFDLVCHFHKVATIKINIRGFSAMADGLLYRPDTTDQEVYAGWLGEDAIFGQESKHIKHGYSWFVPPPPNMSLAQKREQVKAGVHLRLTRLEYAQQQLRMYGQDARQQQGSICEWTNKWIASADEYLATVPEETGM